MKNKKNIQNSLPLHTTQPGLSEQFKYSEFMRFMNKVSDGESSQQPIDTWTEEFTKEMGEAQGSASTSTQLNQEDEWVRDFAEHKAKQGNFVVTFVLFTFTHKTISGFLINRC